MKCVRVSDPVHRGAGHLRLRGLREQQLRAVLHQLRQRDAAALLQPAYLQTRAGKTHPDLSLRVAFEGVIEIISDVC